ncbi:nSTAND1 domain-containing NTPase [Mastigocoleus testarum]|uniref:CHAT domain-containing protein n=1 Tax=Mastigocoleus testarum BC008 TaxID=371196 RepID=A0A0V7ZD08_9CYAN|nr:CHAT domain-containing protein [Mastigocoleus testarum]KST62349.1 hypothetical protein BC008_09260 [Mastigocoleus testarum BC008]KST63121.1 hypothetical protein BC008_12495 [Mastigocoleus testarum BC008]
MQVLVSLKFGDGDFTNGFPEISIFTSKVGSQHSQEIEIQLPPAPEIRKSYQNWQKKYINLFKNLGIRILIPRSVATSLDLEHENITRGFNKNIATNWSPEKQKQEFEKSKQECDSEALLQKAERYASELRTEVNQWLEKVKSKLEARLELDPNSQILLEIHTQNITLQQTKDILHRLPWREWDYFQECSGLEVILCLSESNSPAPKVKDDGIFRRVRITSIFGDSKDINVKRDKELIAKLEKRGAELINLEQPQRQDFSKLWDEPCNILFYSGHSETFEDGTVGSLQINSTDNLSLQEIRNTLGEAVKKGLKLAIFNSCDGLGLAKQLADLHLPYIIVWREPVPDKTAIGFIEYFLSSYAQGESLFTSVRNARLKLVELTSQEEREKQIPGLNWLPIICKNTSVPPPTWKDLGGLTGKLPHSPYKGLSAFQEEDAEYFFGREKFIADLFEAAKSKPLVPVVGASGSGKSSVVFAGLVPRLREDGIQIVSFRPGNNPFDALAVALSSHIQSVIGTQESNPNPPVIGTRGNNLNPPVIGIRGNNSNTTVIGTKGNNLNPPVIANQQSNPNPSVIATQGSNPQPLETSNECAIPTQINLLHDKQALCRLIENIVASSEIPPKSSTNASQSCRDVACNVSTGDDNSVAGMYKGQTSSQRFILIADQFEELYTLTPESQQQPFLNLLLHAVKSAPNFSLVLTLRADFYGHAISNRDFSDLLQQGIYNSSPMNQSELRAAIEQPAAKMKVELEPGLTDKLIDELGNQAGSLPLLEFTLFQLWEKHDKWYLNHQAYKEIGGLKQALAKYADSILSPLSARNKEKAERIFIQLVSPGEGTEDTKRKATRAEVGKENWDWVEFFANQRLLVTGWDETTQEKTVEIIHEALIREWGMLREWIKSNRQFRVWQERLQFTVVKWEDKGRDSEYLLSGGNLGEAEGWFNDEKYREYLSDSQSKFIRESLQERDRKEQEKVSQQQEKTRLQKRAIKWLSGGLLAASLATGFAGWNWVEAKTSAIASEINSLSTRSEYLFGLKNYEDALIEAIKGNELLAKSWWRTRIPTDTQQQIKIALHNAIHDSVELEQHTLTGHQDWVYQVGFSPDGKTIASASGDKTVKLWSTNGKLLHTLTGHQNSVYHVGFSPDGKTIASASWDKTVKLWNWDFDNLLTRGCNRLEGYLVSYPDKLEELKVCQTPQVLAAVASNFIRQGEDLAKNGDFEDAVEKFRQAKKWNPKLDFNPESKAKAISLKEEGRSKK